MSQWKTDRYIQLYIQKTLGLRSWSLAVNTELMYISAIVTHICFKEIDVTDYRRTKYYKSQLDVISLILQMLDSGLSVVEGKLALVSERFDWSLEFDDSLKTSTLESGLILTFDSSELAGAFACGLSEVHWQRLSDGEPVMVLVKDSFNRLFEVGQEMALLA